MSLFLLPLHSSKINAIEFDMIELLFTDDCDDLFTKEKAQLTSLDAHPVMPQADSSSMIICCCPRHFILPDSPVMHIEGNELSLLNTKTHHSTPSQLTPSALNTASTGSA